MAIASSDFAPGLHPLLAPARGSFRVGVWLERYDDPAGYRRFAGQGDGMRTHPGCVEDEPAWLPAGSLHTTFQLWLPRLGNGHPVALPGLLAGWDEGPLRWENRTSSQGLFEVQGWSLPLACSLGPLHALLLAFRDAHGEGWMAPQTAPLLRLLGELQRRCAEGPLLPTPLTPSEDGRSRLGWVPVVTVAEVVRWHEELRAFPSASALLPRRDPYHEAVPALDERFPTRLARFLIEVCAASTGTTDALADLSLSEQWRTAPARLEELHRSHGSCLYPSHPVLAPTTAPPAHLHVGLRLPDPVAPATSATPVGPEPPAPPPAAQRRARRSDALPSMDLPYVASVGLAAGDAAVSLDRLSPRHEPPGSLVEDRGNLWTEPADTLWRSWLAGLRLAPWMFARPELLAGSTRLTSSEASVLLEPALSQFSPRQGLDLGGVGALFPGRGPHRWLGVTLQGRAPPRLRVRWEPPAPDAATDADAVPPALAAFREARFAPALDLLVGDVPVAIDEAERLLAGASGRLVVVGGASVERQALEEAVALVRARRQVIARIGQGGTVSWAQALELEDSWRSERDHDALASVFFEAWQRFVEGLAEGAGVPDREVPDTFQGELRPYQRRGLSWMAFLVEHGLGGCLADDMGLGKTVQVLALLALRRAAGAGPSLVVAPTSVVSNWRREAARFVPSLRVHVHQGGSRPMTPAALERVLGSVDLVVTSYALALHDRELLAPRRWSLLIVDEAQYLKNPAAKRTRAVKAFQADARLALTGTPVENRLEDLWSLFDLLDPGLLGGPTRFARAFLAPIRQGNVEALARLHRRLGPFLLRRTKADRRIALELPDKQEQDVECLLTREQRALYQAMTEAALQGISDKQGVARRAHLLAALTHFKQICDHPEVFRAHSGAAPAVAPEDDDLALPPVSSEPLQDIGSLVARSGKLQRAVELLTELLAAGQAVLIFTQFVRMGDLLVRVVRELLGREPLFYHGALAPRARDAVVDAFQREDGPPVLIVSLRAGGSGLNLTRASAVVHYDRWWNPAVEDQATDRAHRIGQTRKVNVIRLVCRGTLEERIAALLFDKRTLADRVLMGAADEDWLSNLDEVALRQLLALDLDTTDEESDA